MKIILTLFLAFFLTRRGASALNGNCDAPDGACSGGDANSDFCTGGSCVCNVHYEPNSDDTACQKITCTANGVECIKVHSNSYCDTTSGTAECGCGFLAPADGTTGACTQSTCTDSTGCGSGSHGALCISGKCQCPVNKIPSDTACIDRNCANDNDCTVNGDANSECDTTNNKCICKTGWTSDNESCKKTCTNATSDCHEDAYCNTYCICNINYEGDGVATCTQKSCTSTADCGHADLVCDTTNSKCECKSGFETSGATCVESTTTVQTTTAEITTVETAGNGSSSASFSVQLIFFILGFYRVAKMFE